jgi:hypothetical protein
METYVNIHISEKVVNLLRPLALMGNWLPRQRSPKHFHQATVTTHRRSHRESPVDGGRWTRISVRIRTVRSQKFSVCRSCDPLLKFKKNRELRPDSTKLSLDFDRPEHLSLPRLYSLSSWLSMLKEKLWRYVPNPGLTN